MTIGTLSLTGAMHPSFHEVRHSPPIQREQKAVLPTGNHIAFMVDEQNVIPTRKPEPEEVSATAASESVKWILDHPSADNFTDAVHEQLLKSFLLENGLAVTSSTESAGPEEVATGTTA